MNARNELEALYRQGYEGWSARHFHERYVEDHGGRRSYTWVKNRLRAAGLVKRGRRRGRHRLRRPRKPLEGLMVHRDGSTHEWVPGRAWDLIVTSDDATGRVYSGFCVKEEGTWSFGMGVHMSNLPYAAPGIPKGRVAPVHGPERRIGTGDPWAVAQPQAVQRA